MKILFRCMMKKKSIQIGNTIANTVGDDLEDRGEGMEVEEQIERLMNDPSLQRLHIYENAEKSSMKGFGVLSK